jgi:hypothetical protein
MVTDRAEDLRTIMSDNATFIQFPPLGSSTSLITVYGDHRVNIQRTIRSIMQLVSQTFIHAQAFSNDFFYLLGLPILRRIFLALTSSIQRPASTCQSQYHGYYGAAEANINSNWC